MSYPDRSLSEMQQRGVYFNLDGIHPFKKIPSCIICRGEVVLRYGNLPDNTVGFALYCADHGKILGWIVASKDGSPIDENDIFRLNPYHERMDEELCRCFPDCYCCCEWDCYCGGYVCIGCGEPTPTGYWNSWLAKCTSCVTKEDESFLEILRSKNEG